MKKRYIPAGVLMALCLLYTTAGAETFKFGYVDIQQAVSESLAGKEAMEQFKSEVKKMEDDILAEKEQIEKLGEVLQKQSMMLTDSVRREKEKELLRRQRDYERQVKDSKTELQIKEAELTNDILEQLLPVVRQYGADNGYTIIFERSEKVLLYATDSFDLTGKIIAIFDAQYKKGQ